MHQAPECGNELGIILLESDALEKLVGYFQSTREDAKSFIKDPKALSAAIEALTYREKTVRALISTFERIVE